MAIITRLGQYVGVELQNIDASASGNSIHVDDISIEGIEIPHDVNFTVITVVPPKGGVKDLEGEEEEGKE